MEGERNTLIVTKKLIAPKIELTPAVCNPKITESTAIE
jgi:hypothetical protein